MEDQISDRSSPEPVQARFEERGTPEQLAALYGALAAAAAGFSSPLKTGHVDFTGPKGRVNYHYATLADVHNATRAALGKQGLAVMTPLSILAHDDAEVTAVLSHKDGGRLLSHVRFTPQGQIKELGGQTTYLRRYATCALLNVEGVEESAEESEGQGPVVTPRNRQAPEPAQAAKPAPVKAAAPAPAKPAPVKPPSARAKPKSDPPQQAPPQNDEDAPGVELAESHVESEVEVPLTPETKKALGLRFRELGYGAVQATETCIEVTGQEPAEITEANGVALLAHLNATGEGS